MTSNENYYVTCHRCGGRGTKAFSLEMARYVAKNHAESGHPCYVVTESGKLVFKE